MIRCATLALALCSAACSRGPDTVLFNGKIFTADAARPFVQALAITGERIVLAGATPDVLAAAGSRTRLIDLGGRTVVPGLNDAHAAVKGSGADAARVTMADALAQGVTSLQVFSHDRPVADTAAAFLQADGPMRVRVLRMPEPDATGVNRDSRPHFPPQPTPRLDVRGMGFALRGDQAARMEQAVGWAYGSEDPIALHPLDPAMLAGYVETLEKKGLAEVWREKRPRIEGPALIPDEMVDRIGRIGVVVVQAPGGDVSLASLVRRSVTVALGSSGEPRGLGLVHWASAEVREPERLSREDAVSAAARGGAASEFNDRDKGQLRVGMLADLAVLSSDLFTVPEPEMPAIRSVLTMIGGRIVHDTGAVR